MSHTVTVRTATVTTTGSNIIINTEYLKTYRGLLKVIQMVLGIVCVGIMAYHMESFKYYSAAEIFFLLMVTTFWIATFLLLLSCLISISTESIISKTIYEVIYHAAAFGLLFAASLSLIVKVTSYHYRSTSSYELLLGTAICGLINCVLYFFSTVLALRIYRGH